EGGLMTQPSHPDPIAWLTGKPGPVQALDHAPMPALVTSRLPPTATPTPTIAATATVVSTAIAPAKPKKTTKLPGSGIPPRRIAVVLKWARRFTQVFCFALFMYFLFQTGFRGSFAARADTPVRMPLPVEAFLLAPPFVGPMTVL